jgi:hypothetical protein
MKLPTDVVMSVRDLVNSMQPNTRLRAVKGPLDHQLREDEMTAGQHTVGHAASRRQTPVTPVE